MNPKKTNSAIGESALPMSLALSTSLLLLAGCSCPRQDPRPLDVTQEEFELLWVKGRMWGPVRPGEMTTPAGPEVLEAYVFSENNANTRFSAEMYVSEHGLYPVVVGRGRSCDDWVSGSGVMGNTFGAGSVPLEDAIAIASALSVPVQYRKHPGHRLEAGFEPGRESYRVGEKVMAVFHVKNVGQTQVVFPRGGDYRSNNRPDSFAFQIKWEGEEQKDIGPHHPFGGGLVRYVTLQPGESLSEQIDLTKWCSFSKPGQYEIACATTLDLCTQRYVERAKPDNSRFAHERWDESLKGTIRVVLRE